MQQRRTTIRYAIGFGLAFSAALGCRRHDTPAAAPPATQQAAIVTPATQPVQPVACIFIINGQPFTFPPCKLVTKTTDGATRVTLCSDDPPEALRDGYTGNSFYFRFTMDDVTDLAGQQYVFHNSAADPDDSSTNGLFIYGGRQTLRPQDLSIDFDRVESGETIVTVGGTFTLHEDQDGHDAPQTVRAQAQLEPVVSEAKK